MRSWIFGFAALAIASQASAKPSKIEVQIAEQLKRTPAQIEPLIKVVGDRMDPRIEISSYGASQIVNKGWIASTTFENAFLRAYINRKTGNVTAQIYHVESYSGSGWNFYNRASYQAPSGLQETPVERVGSDVNCYSYGCSYVEDLIIPLDFEMLEGIAAAYDSGAQVIGLQYRLFAQSGMKMDGGLPANEIIAFVHVVQRAKGDLPIVTPTPPVAPPAKEATRPAPAAAKPSPAPKKPAVKCITC